MGERFSQMTWLVARFVAKMRVRLKRKKAKAAAEAEVSESTSTSAPTSTPPCEEPKTEVTERDPLRSSFKKLFAQEAERQGVPVRDLIDGYQLCSVGNMLEDDPKVRCWKRAEEAFKKWREDHLSELKTRAQTQYKIMDDIVDDASDRTGYD